MAQSNDVLSGQPLYASKKKLQKCIDNVVSNLENHDVSILMKDRIHLLGWNDTFRSMLSLFDECELAHRNLIINSAYTLNDVCGLTVPLYLLTIQDLLKNAGSVQKRVDEILEDIKSLVIKKTKSSLVIDEWTRSIHDEATKDYEEYFLSAVNRAGAMGTVTIERHDGPSEIRIENGLVVDSDIHHFLYNSVPRNIEFNDAIALVVEGAIINVSEIHHLLTHCYETKTKAVLFATNYSEDVANTLAVNWADNNVYVLPLIVPNDLENINSVKDISQILGIVPVSKDSGHLVSGIDFTDYPLSQIRYSKKERVCLIEAHKSNIQNIHLLRNEIEEKLKKEKVEDTRDVLKKRLSKLSVRCAKLYINCSESEKGLLEDRASNLFQLMSSCARQGIIDAENLYPKKVKNLPKHLPASYCKLAIRMAASDAAAIDSIRAIIKLD